MTTGILYIPGSLKGWRKKNKPPKLNRWEQDQAMLMQLMQDELDAAAARQRIRRRRVLVWERGRYEEQQL